MKYDKLVRSKILSILHEKKIPCSSHTAGPKEYKRKLYEKLVEESQEFITTPTKEELADILEVIEAVKKLNCWSNEEIEEIRLKKRGEKGHFEDPIILEES
jgi:predicted house-cleaning noncanonical NTP pyrophosphatase (MazG superfamily)